MELEPSWRCPTGVRFISVTGALLVALVTACERDQAPAPDLHEAPAGANVQTPPASKGGRATAESSPALGKPDPAELESALKTNDARLLSSTLSALVERADVGIEEEFHPRVLDLATHSDPGVRGRALRLLGLLSQRDVPPWPRPGAGWGPRHGIDVRTTVRRPKWVPVTLRSASIARAWRALSDPNPYVRAEACHALSHMGYIFAIHGLIRLVDDDEPSEYFFDEPQTGGIFSSVRHNIPGLTFVGQSAMRAIQVLSADAIHPELTDPTKAPSSWESDRKLLKSWYKKRARDRVPLPSPEPILPSSARYIRAPAGGEHVAAGSSQ